MTGTWLAPPTNWTETAFFNDNDERTNLHTRSFTILAALNRLDLLRGKNYQMKRRFKLPNEVDPPSRLVLHIVGADFREGNEISETMQAFDQLINMFHSHGKVQSIDHGYDELVLVMIGPNVARKLHGKDEHVSLPGNKSLRLMYAVELWDEYLASEKYLSPTAVFCFNAGVWGYDEWLPTFQRIMVEEETAPIIVTSYNECESIDDADALEDIEMVFYWKWRHESNPFASLIPRASKNTIANRILHENSHWQCFVGK